jgi:hypothetical protein
MDVELGSLRKLSQSGVEKMYRNRKYASTLEPFSEARKRIYARVNEDLSYDTEFYRKAGLPPTKLRFAIQDKNDTFKMFRRGYSTPIVSGLSHHFDADNCDYKMLNSVKISDNDTLTLYDPYFEPTGRLSDLAFVAVNEFNAIVIPPKKSGKIRISLNLSSMNCNTHDLDSCVHIVDCGNECNVNIDEEVICDDVCTHNILVLYLIRPNATVNINRRVLSKSKNSNVFFESRFIQFPESTLNIKTDYYADAKYQDCYFITAHRDTVTTMNNSYEPEHGQVTASVEMNHVGKNGKSDLDIRTAEHASTKAYIAGNIIVDKDSTGIDAKFNNKNLLLDPSASVISEPKLEISNHDISCEHGCTTSDIQQADLFLLESKGFSKQVAKKVIVKAFLGTLTNEL